MFLKNYKLIALDVDGTITEFRGSTRICSEIISTLREIENRGVKVSFISSNSLPVVVGLSKYIGLTGPVIGETGSLIYFKDESIVHLTNISTIHVVKPILENFNQYVRESWQNLFRIHEYAFIIKEDYRDRDWWVFSLIKEFVEKNYSDVRVEYSGYAIHLVPRDVSKGKALRYVIEKLSIPADQVICIGDSYMDYDFIKECGLKIAVMNADEELRMNVDIVLNKPSCYGVVEFLNSLLKSDSI
ncbi:MAG: phosphoglycolate phosphatase [Desulfurococcaceae archaeon]